MKTIKINNKISKIYFQYSMDITNLTKIYHIHKNYKAKKTRIM